jgi:hypothetical protein
MKTEFTIISQNLSRRACKYVTVTCMEHRTTVTNANCYDILERGLKLAICMTVGWRLSEGIPLVAQQLLSPHSGQNFLNSQGIEV